MTASQRLYRLGSVSPESISVMVHELQCSSSAGQELKRDSGEGKNAAPPLISTFDGRSPRLSFLPFTVAFSSLHRTMPLPPGAAPPLPINSTSLNGPNDGKLARPTGFSLSSQPSAHSLQLLSSDGRFASSARDFLVIVTLASGQR